MLSIRFNIEMGRGRDIQINIERYRTIKKKKNYFQIQTTKYGHTKQQPIHIEFIYIYMRY